MREGKQVYKNEDEREEKLELLYKNCYSYMCYCVSKHIKNRQDIEDTVQDAMVKLITVIDRVDVTDVQRLRYFCGTVARNRALDRIRSYAEETLPLSELYELPNSAEATPETAVIDGEAVQALVKAIDKLDGRHRDVCMLKFSEGYKEREIAEALGISVKTVHTRIARGRALLLSTLQKKGNTQK